MFWLPRSEVSAALRQAAEQRAGPGGPITVTVLATVTVTVTVLPVGSSRQQPAVGVQSFSPACQCSMLRLIQVNV